MRAHLVDIREEVKPNPSPTNYNIKFKLDYKQLCKNETPSNIEQMYAKYNILITAVYNKKSREELSNMLVKYLKSLHILRKELNEVT